MIKAFVEKGARFEEMSVLFPNIPSVPGDVLFPGIPAVPGDVLFPGIPAVPGDVLFPGIPAVAGPTPQCARLKTSFNC